MHNSEIGHPRNLTATGTVKVGTVAQGGGQMLGFYVNSTSSGVIAFRDGGAGGTVLSGSITPAIGFHRFPATFQTDLHMTLISGSINVTVFVN